MISTELFSSTSATKLSMQTIGLRIVAVSRDPHCARASLAELLAVPCCCRDSAKVANNRDITVMAAPSFSFLTKDKDCACQNSPPLTCHHSSRARPQHNLQSRNCLMHFLDCRL